MKKLILFILISCTIFSCTSIKKIEAPKGEIEIIIPCSEFKSNTSMFRISSSGESIDQSTAKKKAISNARIELAGMISTTIKSVGDNYVKSSEVNNVEEILEKFEEVSRTVIDQEISGAISICDRLTKTDEDKYKYYVALELSGERVVKKYFKALTKNDKLLLDYSYQKFKNNFESEIKKLNQ